MTLRRAGAVLLAVTALGLLAWFGDPFALMVIGYLPVLIVLSLTGDWSSWSAFADPAMLRSILVLLAAVGLIALAYRLWPDKPLLKGLPDHGVRRLLLGSVIVAVVVPTIYAITRIAWALGIPLGLSREFLEQIQPIVRNGLALALFALVGVVLTIGLLRPWSRRFPRWIPRIGGRAVPVGLARNSALVVALVVMSAGCYFIRSMLIDPAISIAPENAHKHVGAWLPEMLWPVWALALTSAALAYAETRRREAAVRGLEDAQR